MEGFNPRAYISVVGSSPNAIKVIYSVIKQSVRDEQTSSSDPKKEGYVCSSTYYYDAIFRIADAC